MVSEKLLELDLIVLCLEFELHLPLHLELHSVGLGELPSGLLNSPYLVCQVLLPLLLLSPSKRCGLLVLPPPFAYETSRETNRSPPAV